LRILSILLLLSTSVWATVPLKDNLLFAFEKCKSISVDLHKGQLKEAVVSSFDAHCIRDDKKPLNFKCNFFDTGDDKITSTEVFKGGSDLGVGELKSDKGSKIKFVIGKGFASFEAGEEQKACAGIFLFEKEALEKASKKNAR
jgi:hypothetical protein